MKLEKSASEIVYLINVPEHSFIENCVIGYHSLHTNKFRAINLETSLNQKKLR